VPDGEVASYEAFFRRVEPALRRAAHLYTGDVEQAHDLVQEALVRAWERWPRLARHPHPDAWCLKVMRNLATSRWRRVRLEEKHRSATRTAAADAPGAGHLDIAAALKRLPADQVQALVLHDVLGHTADEVAQEMGTVPGTVRSWLSRGRRALAAELGLDRPQRAGEGRQ
jgi:RNA polymerase sigma-70 factor (ECF subfamily)